MGAPSTALLDGARFKTKFSTVGIWAENPRIITSEFRPGTLEKTSGKLKKMMARKPLIYQGFKRFAVITRRPLFEPGLGALIKRRCNGWHQYSGPLELCRSASRDPSIVDFIARQIPRPGLT